MNYYDVACEVCGQPVKVIIQDRPCDDEPTKPTHFFCQEHYDNWRNNEIELPAERLTILE